jgi:hypothetical protein
VTVTPVGLVGEAGDVPVEAPDPDDAVEVTLVAVVEDQVTAGRVVADLVDVGVGAAGDSVGGQCAGQCPGLLRPVEVVHGHTYR